MGDITPQTVAKQLSGLQKALGNEQMVWGVGGTLYMDLGAPTMRQEHDGVIACTRDRLHFFRKSLFGKTHESLPLSVVESVEVATLRFANGDVEAVVLNRSDEHKPWGISGGLEQREFIVEKLSARP